MQAQNKLERLIPLLAEKQGVTEQLKAENQLEWVGMMNNIKAQAEEMIYAEIVCEERVKVKDGYILYENVVNPLTNSICSDIMFSN